MFSGGYRFFVMPEHFVVDIPHSATGPKQTEDNQKLSNVLWRDFYMSMLPRYGLHYLPPYKGIIARLGVRVVSHKAGVARGGCS